MRLKVSFLLFVVMLLVAANARAQLLQRPRPGSVPPLTFKLAWDVPIDEHAKLIEIGPARPGDVNRLLMLTEGADLVDARRGLIMTHWDGFRFATDGEAEIRGSAPDTLVMGRFQPGTPKPGAKQVEPAGVQIVTSDGLYDWDGKAFHKLFTAPPEVRLAMIYDKIPSLLIVKAGDDSSAYEVGEKDAHVAKNDPPQDADGYAKLAVGTQEFPGADGMSLAGGARWSQSFWDSHGRWMIGLAPGHDAGIQGLPKATVGDRLVVQRLRAESHQRTFWTTSSSDFEEAWRGDAIPDRVLDVRVGDPRNEGKPGILVLTVTADRRQRRLRFYQPTGGLLP